MMNTFYKKNKLTPIINVSGFMTKIGASIVRNENTAGRSKTAIVDAVNRAATMDALASLARRPFEERETATRAAPTRR